MSDDLFSIGQAPATAHRPQEITAFLRAKQARVGSWLAAIWQRILVGILILEIPIQLDTYLAYDAAEAQFGAISGFNISLTSVCLALLYIQWLPRQLVESRRFVISKSLFAYVALTAISVLWAVDRSRTLFQVFLLIQSLLLLVYLVNHLKTRKDILFVMTALLIGLSLQGFFMAAAKLSNDDIVIGPVKFEIINKLDRVVGSFGSPNVAASYFALLVAPCFSLLLMPVSKRLKCLALVAFVLSCTSLIFTMSRGGWFAAAIAMALLTILAYRHGWMSPMAFFLMSAIAILFVAVFHQSIAERLLGDDNGSLAGRQPLSAISTSMLAENPLGIGGNNWDLVAEPRAARGGTRGEWFYLVHNKYLLVGTETGWLGLLAYLSFLGSTILCGWRAIKANDRLLSPLAIGLLAGFFAQAVHMSMDVFNGRTQIQMLWLVAALLMAIATILASEKTEIPGARAVEATP